MGRPDSITERCKSDFCHSPVSSPPASSCPLSPVSLSLPAWVWLPGGAWGPPPCRPPTSATPPLPSRTLTLLPSSLELELPPSVLLDLVLVSAPSSGPSSSATPGTLLSSSSSSPTPFWVLLCQRLWVSSA